MQRAYTRIRSLESQSTESSSSRAPSSPRAMSIPPKTVTGSDASGLVSNSVAAAKSSGYDLLCIHFLMDLLPRRRIMRIPRRLRMCMEHSSSRALYCLRPTCILRLMESGNRALAPASCLSASLTTLCGSVQLRSPCNISKPSIARLFCVIINICPSSSACARFHPHSRKFSESFSL